AERRARQGDCAGLAVGEPAVGARTEACTLGSAVDERGAHVEDDRDLDDPEEHRCDEDRDEDEVDHCRALVTPPADGAGPCPHLSGQGPVTLLRALENIVVSAGPATAQIATTRPAVMSVTSTQPGTSPRSDGPRDATSRHRVRLRR